MAQIKNVTDLTKDLIKVYAELRSKKIGLQEAKTISNIAGKLIGTCKVQIDYQKMTGNKNPIIFLEANK